VLWRVVRTHIHAERVDADQWRVVVEGSCTFLSLPRLTKELASVPPGTAASIDLSVDFLDHAAHQAIDDWQRQHEAAGGTVTIRELGGVEMDSATDGPPERAFAQPRSVRPSQSPEALFITCADSSGPGDLLTIRNVGNLVPPNGSDDSVEAAIAFAVERLGVASIVVCGHSSCGAMGSLLVGSTNGATHTPDPLQSWLRHGRATLEAYDDGRHPVARSAADAGFAPVDQLSMVNVAVQMQTLRSHALVRLGYAQDRLHVDGLFYDNSTASVLRVTQHGVAPLHGELIRQ
jgi:carbonic anhydrase